MLLVLGGREDGFQPREVVGELGHVLDLGTCLEGAGPVLPHFSNGLQGGSALQRLDWFFGFNGSPSCSRCLDVSNELSTWLGWYQALDFQKDQT